MTASERGPSTERMKQAAAGSEGSRWAQALSVLVIGVLLSLLLFRTLAGAEAERVELEFNRDASDRVAAFEVALTHGLDSLVALDALYAARPEVDRSVFRAFVSEHLLEEPGVAYLGWAPRVEQDQRRNFELAARADRDDRPEIAAALERYRIFELEAGEPRPAARRPTYFPVLHAEPPRIARHTLGFDLATDPVQGEAVGRALAGTGMTASRRDLLRPDQPERFGVLVLSPVYSQMSAAEEPADRPLGFLIGMFDVGAIVEGALTALEPRGVDLAVHDLGAAESESLLYFHTSRLADGAARPWTADEALGLDDSRPARLAAAETLRVADRDWLVSSRPAPGYVEARRAGTARTALLAGLFLSVVLSGGLFALVGRASETRRYALGLLEAKRSLEDEAVRREEARVDLAMSEERFRQAFGYAPMGIATADLEGRFLQANPALCRMLQYEEDELLRMSIEDVTHPEDAAAEARELERLMGGKAESVQYVSRLRRSDASSFWAELTISAVRDADGTAIYLIGQQQDITERREAIEGLRKAQETQARILDSLPLHVFLKDAEGRIRFINAEGAKFLGRSRDEIIGKTDFDFLPEEEVRELRKHDLEVLESGRTVSREETLTVGRGQRHLLSGKTRIDGEGSDEHQLLGFSIDVTRMREAEEALSQSENRFRQLVENMSSGVAIYEAVDDGADFVIRDYNPAAERMDGVARNDIVGKRLSEVFPGLVENGLVGVLAEVWATGDPIRRPAMEFRDSRGESWRENYVYKLPSGDVVAVYDDVSEAKRLKSILLHAQKMEAVGRLAGGVAHDFNNLLQVVAGNVDLLLGGSLDADRRARRLAEIQEQAERGKQLVRHLLAFSRRESYAPTSLDLGDLLRGADTLLRRLLKENIRLKMELADAPLLAIGDAGQLEQVLMNLVVNASDAMPEGGSLDVRSGTEGDQEVWFSVADNGEGIPEETLDSIFDPYFTTKPAAQGTGLGLAVVDGIVSLHGGRIEVVNRPGEGVEFKVLLPRGDSQPAVTAVAVEEHEEEAGPGGERVLVVEDQELVRRTMESMLGSLGYRVTTAADGGVARELLAVDEFDLLITDIVLPDTTGVELALETRRKWPGLAVLLVSGYAEDALRERGAELRFLQKPFRLADLSRQAAAALAEVRSGDSSTRS